MYNLAMYHSQSNTRLGKTGDYCSKAAERFAFAGVPCPVKSESYLTGVNGKGKIIHLCVLCASSEAGGECPAYSVDSVGSSDPRERPREHNLQKAKLGPRAWLMVHSIDQ